MVPTAAEHLTCPGVSSSLPYLSKSFLSLCLPVVVREECSECRPVNVLSGSEWGARFRGEEVGWLTSLSTCPSLPIPFWFLTCVISFGHPQCLLSPSWVPDVLLKVKYHLHDQVVSFRVRCYPPAKALFPHPKLQSGTHPKLQSFEAICF